MASISDVDAAIVQKLIADSKKLTKANVKKCQNERVLKELTLFQNVSNFLNSSGDSIKSSSSVFHVAVKVYPSPLKLDNTRCNETMVISVENTSKCFTFSPTYWQFLVDVGGGQEISSWSFEQPLEPGKCECISTSFFTSANLSPVEVKVQAIFSISHLEQTFVKTLDVSRISIDVLYLLSPARLSRLEMQDPGRCVNQVLHFSKPDFDNRNNNEEEDAEDDEPLPNVTKFFFKLDKKLMTKFVVDLLLKDCKDRWGDTIIKELSADFSMFYQEQEIIVALRGVSNTACFECNHPRVLHALKSAVLKRLLAMENVQMVCPDDKICEQFYALKLRLEEMSDGQGSIVEVRDLDFLDIYLDLRDTSEMIAFHVISSGGGNSEIEIIE